METKLQISKAILIFQTTTLGRAYLFAQKASQFGARIIELSILGGGGLVLLEVDSELESQLRFEFSAEENEDYHVIKNPSQKIIEAYLSLNQFEVKKHLLIAEHQSLGKIIDFCQQEFNQMSSRSLNSSSLMIYDLRLIRASLPKAILCLTSDESETLIQIETKWKTQDIKVTVIQNIHPELQNYF